jgi:hypothetical protein
LTVIEFEAFTARRGKAWIPRAIRGLVDGQETKKGMAREWTIVDKHENHIYGLRGRRKSPWSKSSGVSNAAGKGTSDSAARR